MSYISFDNIARSALWTTYNNICFYCQKPLNWTDLHIDHIIPEYYKDKPEQLKKLIIDYELNDNFNINASYNLVPVHAKCNQRKGKILFPKQTTLYYLGLTNNREVKIEKEIQKLKFRKNKGYIISKLQSALASELISVKELEKVIESAKQANWEKSKIVLPHGIEFIDEVYDIFYLNTDYSILYDKKVLVGGVYDFIELSNDNNEKVKVSTLREWQDMTKKGYHPLTNADIKMSSTFTFLEEFLEAIKNASMPKISFISEPWIEIDNLDYLSPTILHDFEGNLTKYADKGFSIGNLIDKGIIKRNKGGYYKISLDYDGMETSLIELFRADFNNDGIEDIFVRGWTRAVGGTLGYGFTTILTRFSEKHLIEEIK